MQTPGLPGGEELPAEDGVDLDQIETEERLEEEVETEGEAEPEEIVESEGGGVDERPAATPRRAGRRERQAVELRRLREDNERFGRELRELRQSQQTRPAGPDPAELARREQAEREQVSQLDYAQQIQYWRDKDRRELEQRFQQQQLATSLSLDQASWNAQVAANPLAAKYAARVEERFQLELAAGRPYSRDQVFRYLVGDDGVEAARARASGNGARQAAARRVAQQTTRPGGVRSDGAAPQGRRPADDSYEASVARLEAARKAGIGFW
jgi:hypothetical protein